VRARRAAIIAWNELTPPEVGSCVAQNTIDIGHHGNDLMHI